MDTNHYFELVRRDQMPPEWQRFAVRAPESPPPAAVDPDIAALQGGDYDFDPARDLRSGGKPLIIPETARQPRFHALVADILWPTQDLMQLLLEPASGRGWSAGQIIHLFHPRGEGRPYLVASAGDDDFMEIYARYRDSGSISRYLSNLLPGDILDVSSLTKGIGYLKKMASDPLLLVATDTAAGAMAAIAKTALRAGHEKPVRLVHGADYHQDLFLTDTLTEMAEAYPQFSYDCLSRLDGPRRSVAAAAIEGQDDLSSHTIFLGGAPAVTDSIAARVIEHGARQDRIHRIGFSAGPMGTAQPS